MDCVLNSIMLFSIDDTAADSTQDPHTKETKQTCQQPETSSCQEPAESSSSSQDKDADQVGSTDNDISTATKHQDVEMVPESSNEAQEKEVTPVVSSMEAEPSSASSQVQPAEQVFEQVFLNL